MLIKRLIPALALSIVLVALFTKAGMLRDDQDTAGSPNITQSIAASLSYAAQAATSVPGVSAFIETAITAAEMCDAPFSRTVPAFSETEGAKASEPIRYQWDYAGLRLNAETALFGYSPRYNPGRVGFAPNGRPMIRNSQFNLQVLEDGGTWKAVNLIDVATRSLAAQGVNNWRPAPPGAFGDAAQYADPDVSTESRVVFDNACNAYAILQANRSSLGSAILLFSPDGGHSWSATKIPGTASHLSGIKIEVPSSPRPLSAPPALLIHQYYLYADSPNTLKLTYPAILPDKSIAFPGPFTIATNAITAAGTGGDENYAVSSGDLIHFVYPGETVAYDPLSGRHGTPAFAGTFSRSLQKITSGPIPIGVGVGQDDASVTDDHNQPVIALDKDRYLHVVIGGHGGPLYYRKAAVANSIASWSPIETIGKRPTLLNPHADEYTYPSLITGLHGEPVIAARWSGESYVFRLVLLTKNASTGAWDQQRTLVDPGRSYYAHWYHKLSIDPLGRIFLNYSYYPDNLFADDVEVLKNAYGMTLTNPVDYKGEPCKPTNHDAKVPNYCSYTGIHRTNDTVLRSNGLGQPFQIATTKSFLF